MFKPTDSSTDKEKDFQVTNTHTLETTTLSVTKQWDDNANSDNGRPASLTVWVLSSIWNAPRMLLPDLADTFWQPLSTMQVAASAEGFTPTAVAASLACVPHDRDVIRSSAVLLPVTVQPLPLPEPLSEPLPLPPVLGVAEPWAGTMVKEPSPISITRGITCSGTPFIVMTPDCASATPAGPAMAKATASIALGLSMLPPPRYRFIAVASFATAATFPDPRANDGPSGRDDGFPQRAGAAGLAGVGVGGSPRVRCPSILHHISPFCAVTIRS